ncbi:MAG: cbb3-type cytochrome c oxidase subunit 3 [Rhodobacterales bacterium]|jgi:cytochrome c oxidase cbb3-type subunit 4|nr:cbb3-type cytochrome c oxidase subunit 3 [Gammaproteobacteria bacterium]MBT5440439.1 cbb3-type cytochrome c oxidase subunit 3 [Candidatus Neomarinimicrobiota bacterium]MBT6894983.1 cbb3-type cytochrome c oxidase subunit 3 [Rhodobacterales bacterium]|tara:strand:+ start:5296 stop:5460 length:165 start_codon:yes stop_codon:yes gene_type:complete
MNIDDLRGFSTVLCMISFLAICWWAYGSARKSKFEDAAKIPFLNIDIKNGGGNE